jgi:tetratricopeptide (TPR) repeat protein
LLTYVRLVEGGAAVQFGTAADAPPAGDDEDDTPPNASTALTQAFLLLAQAAEQQQRLRRRRALARARRQPAARARGAGAACVAARAPGQDQGSARTDPQGPEQSPSDARAKLLAETELLRERKMYAEAEQVMAQASKAFPDDTDLLYEQAMLNEKLDRVDEMERLLRRVIAAQARPPARLQRARLLARGSQDPPCPKRAPDPEGARAEPGRAVDHRQHGMGRVQARQSEEAIRLLRGRLPGAPGPGDRRPSRRGALERAGRSEEARRVFRDARSRDAQNDVLRETLARLRVDL